jgi:hypothetical protein
LIAGLSVRLLLLPGLMLALAASATDDVEVRRPQGAATGATHHDYRFKLTLPEQRRPVRSHAVNV